MVDAPPPPLPTFLHVLQGLVFEAEVQLGVVPHPVHGHAAPNHAMARAAVHILELIAEKTRGNLTPEEAEYLRGALHGLRHHLARLAASQEHRTGA